MLICRGGAGQEWCTWQGITKPIKLILEGVGGGAVVEESGSIRDTQSRCSHQGHWP